MKTLKMFLIAIVVFIVIVNLNTIVLFVNGIHTAACYFGPTVEECYKSLMVALGASWIGWFFGIVEFINAHIFEVLNAKGVPVMDVIVFLAPYTMTILIHVALAEVHKTKCCVYKKVFVTTAIHVMHNMDAVAFGTPVIAMMRGTMNTFMVQTLVSKVFYIIMCYAMISALQKDETLQ